MGRRRRWLLGVGLALGGILLSAPSIGAGVLDASWIAPTTNTDGSPLIDLASYRVHYGPETACPGAASLQVASSTASPGPDQTESVRITGLTTGALYFVSVTAVNLSGDESPCSIGVSAVAQIGFSVSPTHIVSFGDVNVGSFADQVFTVQNRGGIVSGSASAFPPFSIVSGSPFTLVGDGATQAVTVRFTPTESATVSTNVDFTADGDTISRPVTGSGLGVAQPSDTITSPVLLTVSPASVVPGGTVTATWSGIAAPTSTDWIGLYAPGTGEAAYLAWIYVSCSQSPGAAKVSDACAFLIPGNMAPGTYELRLFAADGYTRIATGNPFSVTP